MANTKTTKKTVKRAATRRKKSPKKPAKRLSGAGRSKKPPKRTTAATPKKAVGRKASPAKKNPAAPRPKKKAAGAKKSSRAAKPSAKRQARKTTAREAKSRPATGAKRSSGRSSRRSRSSKPFIKIKVVGIGGGGGNALTRMRKDFAVRGVEFVAINTDVQDLESCDAHRKLHIGRALTKGMGAGMNPDLGQQAAEENRSEIEEALRDADMVFLTSGFGGGTGTGAAPVVADISRELGILTVAVITKPFSFEGTSRAKIAEDGIARIKDRVDTLLVIPNDRIFAIIDKNTSVLKAFEKIDDILRSAVQGVAEIISASGLVNVDFADIRAVATGAGMAVIGVGTAGGADRAVKAINQAIHSPLLDISIDGARNVLFGVAGGRDLRMSEINDAAKVIIDSVDPGARIIFGAYHDRKLKSGTVKITLIATGFNGILFKREPDSLTLFTEEDESLGELPELGDEVVGGGQVRSGKKRDAEPQEEEAEDILDTPTFLRKRGKRR